MNSPLQHRSVDFDGDRNSDPPPGWQALWKGLQKLRLWAEGYELGAK